MFRRPPSSPLFPSPTLFRSVRPRWPRRERRGLLDPLPRRTRAWRLSRQQLGRLRRQPERSEEHTSELQSHLNLVCRLLLEKKKTHPSTYSERVCDEARNLSD